MTRFETLSRIPGTPQHRRYTAALEFVDAVEQLATTLIGDPPPVFPRPPRDAAAVEHTAQTMRAILLSLEAVARGTSREQAIAVLNEHYPTPPTGGT